MITAHPDRSVKHRAGTRWARTRAATATILTLTVLLAPPYLWSLT